jgi:hypothetical protein
MVGMNKLRRCRRQHLGDAIQRTTNIVFTFYGLSDNPMLMPSGKPYQTLSSPPEICQTAEKHKRI